MQHKRIKSRTKHYDASIDSLEMIHELIESNDDFYCIAYCDSEVLFGQYVNKNFIFYQDRSIEFARVQKLRIFNIDRELYLWRKGDKLVGRLRVDDDGDETDVVDAKQLLVGTDFENIGDGYIELFEDRGFRLVIPNKNFKVDNSNRVAILTRNYVEFNDNYQAGYVDSRMVDLIQF